MKNLDLKSEKGAVLVVEAAIVFPIVFFVVIILLYTGNLFYQQSGAGTNAAKTLPNDESTEADHEAFYGKE